MIDVTSAAVKKKKSLHASTHTESHIDMHSIVKTKSVSFCDFRPQELQVLLVHSCFHHLCIQRNLNIVPLLGIQKKYAITKQKFSYDGI